MRDSSSTGGGYIQAMTGSTQMICCAVHDMNIICTWLVGKSFLEVINEVHPLVNLIEISFGLLYCAPETYSQLDYHILPVPYDYAGTKFWIMMFFCNYATWAYVVQSNMQPSIGDQAHHVLDVYEAVDNV